MLSRRQFVKTSLAGSTLIAAGSTVPQFLASTAFAADEVKNTDRILVVVQLTGGNDGLNTVIPYGDDLYHKARPTLGFQKKQVIPVDDQIGLHPGLQQIRPMVEAGQVAVIQGVGYPNPNRSHFESMDIWHTCDLTRKATEGWLGRTIGWLKLNEGQVPAFHLGKGKLPLALHGTAVPTLHPDREFDLDLTGQLKSQKKDRRQRNVPPPPSKPIKRDEKYKARRKVIDELTAFKTENANDLLQFVQRTSVQTYTAIDQLREIMKGEFKKPNAEYVRDGQNYRYAREGLAYELQLISRMIDAGFGARIYYVAIDGFDTHSKQANAHQVLMQKLSTAIARFFNNLKATGHQERVVLLTFSEFGRRVKENGSRGTDHGAGSSMFVFGPAVKGGLVGEHPSLEADKLLNGDLKYHTDFRQVYATVLDQWLKVDSQRILGGKFAPVELFKNA